MKTNTTSIYLISDLKYFDVAEYWTAGGSIGHSTPQKFAVSFDQFIINFNIEHTFDRQRQAIIIFCNQLPEIYSTS